MTNEKNNEETTTRNTAKSVAAKYEAELHAARQETANCFSELQEIQAQLNVSQTDVISGLKKINDLQKTVFEQASSITMLNIQIAKLKETSTA